MIFGIYHYIKALSRTVVLKAGLKAGLGTPRDPSARGFVMVVT